MDWVLFLTWIATKPWMRIADQKPTLYESQAGALSGTSQLLPGARAANTFSCQVNA